MRHGIHRGSAFLLAALAVATLAAPAVSAVTAPFSASWIMVSGSSATGVDVQLEIRGSDGVTVIGTGGVAALAPAATAATIRTALEGSWVDGTGSVDLVLNIEPTKIDVLDDLDRSFRVFIQPSPGGPYSEVTTGGTVIDGVTYALTSAVVTGIPTLSEWGLILLTILLVASGIWMLRRRQTMLAG